jgi:hypothetical protein
MQPISLPPGRTRVEAREESRRTVEGERAGTRSQRAMNQFGDVDHQLKKARVVGMQAQAEKIAIDTIQTKIQLLRENADVYRSIHGEQQYNEMIVALINKMTRKTKKCFIFIFLSITSVAQAKKDIPPRRYSQLAAARTSNLMRSLLLVGCCVSIDCLGAGLYCFIVFFAPLDSPSQTTGKRPPKTFRPDDVFF